MLEPPVQTYRDVCCFHCFGAGCQSQDGDDAVVVRRRSANGSVQRQIAHPVVVVLAVRQHEAQALQVQLAAHQLPVGRPPAAQNLQSTRLLMFTCLPERQSAVTRFKFRKADETHDDCESASSWWSLRRRDSGSAGSSTTSRPRSTSRAGVGAAWSNLGHAGLALSPNQGPHARLSAQA